MVSSRGDPYTLRCNSCLARNLALGFAVIAVAACILLWALLILLIIKRRRRAFASLSPPTLSTSTHRYTYTALRSASPGLLCEDSTVKSSHHVHAGVLPDGSSVLIRKLTHEGLVKEGAFTSEIDVISRVLHHPNLLPLQGFCYENGDALLVYDYMPFNLRHCLFGHDMSSAHVANGRAEPSSSLYANSSKKGKTDEGGFAHSEAATMNCAGHIQPPLDGGARLNILRGVAAALVHLHENRILHRDVKASNVMLTEQLEPRLRDTGVARFTALKCSNKLPTAFVAPEVAYTGKATEKADVYSFGVLALVVASGRPAVDGQFRIIEWVWMLHLSNKLLDALDPWCMLGSHNETSTSGTSLDVDMEMQWRCVLHVALLCCHPLLEARPTMRQAAMVLQETIIMPLPVCMPTFPNAGCRASSEPA